MNLLAVIAVAVGLFGGGGAHAKHVALERFPQHCAPYSIRYRHLPDSLGYVRAGTCRIWLDLSFHALPFSERCTLLTHEVGHLAGLPDEQVPHIMQRNPPVHKPCL